MYQRYLPLLLVVQSKGMSLDCCCSVFHPPTCLNAPFLITCSHLVLDRLLFQNRILHHQYRCLPIPLKKKEDTHDLDQFFSLRHVGESCLDDPYDIQLVACWLVSLPSTSLSLACVTGKDKQSCLSTLTVVDSTNLKCYCIECCRQARSSSSQWLVKVVHGWLFKAS